jgi:hypothetical protein
LVPRRRYIMREELAAGPAGMIVDHIDHDPLNNLRSNLRIATQGQNMQNKRKAVGTSSQYRGVSYTRGKYQASIGINDKRLRIGSYEVEKEAARAYDRRGAETVRWTSVLELSG